MVTRVSPPSALTAVDIAWLAGLFEGEGSFGLEKGRNPRIQLASTDRDVVEKAACKLGLSVLGPYDNSKRLTPNTKPLWVISSGGATAAGLMMSIYPFMGLRRRERIKQVLTTWKTLPAPQKRYITRTWNGWNGRNA